MVTSQTGMAGSGRSRGSLSAAQARRLVLAAQGLAGTPARATARGLRGLLQRLGAIQIDSINVVARSHELVLAARTGSGAGALFDKAVYGGRAGFEYWGHAASFLPIESYRLFLPRMERMVHNAGGWTMRHREEHAKLYPAVVDRIRAEGPLAASAFRDPSGVKRDSWWDWAPAKHVMEDLFFRGTLLVHDRIHFERRYDLAERVLPPGLDLSTPTEAEATVGLLLTAARALGVGTADDLGDYFRIRATQARPAIAELTAAGLLERVEVEGWPAPGYLLPGTTIPRRAEFPPTLLSPFDSLVWASMSGARERTSRLFGFDYRLEIYIPAAKRVHGYYTTPVLAGGRLVARVDPKHDRKARRLLLRAVHLEPHTDPDEALAAVAGAAWRLARALGVTTVELDGPAQDGVMVGGTILPGGATRCRALLDQPPATGGALAGEPAAPAAAEALAP